MFNFLHVSAISLTDFEKSGSASNTMDNPVG